MAATFRGMRSAPIDGAEFITLKKMAVLNQLNVGAGGRSMREATVDTFAAESVMVCDGRTDHDRAVYSGLNGLAFGQHGLRIQ